MAQAKPEVTKSQSIRDYFKKNPNAHVKEVVSALAKNGITVTDNHVYGVKGKMETRKQEKKAAKAAAAANSSIGKAPSKSSAVRAVLRANRHFTAKEVVSALAEQGISATEGLVYFVKGQMKANVAARRRRARLFPRSPRQLLRQMAMRSRRS